ncbi:hypothetical protein KAT45_02200 [Candidatus Aerophobetes bacterium]|nr:hypothetical protein [Candidatus Aerophobetes bacterium]
MKTKKKKVKLIAFSLVLGLLAMVMISLPSLACEFTFNYERIEAPIGTVGEIGVRIEKTHQKCTMDDPLDYQFDWKGIQILGETDWEEIDPQLYEKWFQVSLSSIGEGFLKISRDCSKEGYEEAVLPITITKGEGDWQLALKGEYPYELQSKIEVEKTCAQPFLNNDVLKVGKVEVKLPFLPQELVEYKERIELYYYTFKEKALPLLVVSSDFFYRFDQYEN